MGARGGRCQCFVVYSLSGDESFFDKVGRFVGWVGGNVFDGSDQSMN